MIVRFVWPALLFIGVMSGCAGKIRHTPWQTVQVMHGDNLYALSKRYQINFALLAKANHLNPPYLLSTGQSILVPVQPSEGMVLIDKPDYDAMAERQAAFDRLMISLIAEKKILTSHAKVEAMKGKQEKSEKKWLKPARGKLGAHVNLQSVKMLEHQPEKTQGVDILGQLNDAVVASKSGKVVYVGAGGRRFGQLVVLQHGAHYLSVYAYNKKTSVHLGDQVHQGQKIAMMGEGYGGRAMLYFEIRKDGKRVSPLNFFHNE